MTTARSWMVCTVVVFCVATTRAENPPQYVLFDGSNLKKWDYAPDGWSISKEDQSLTCHVTTRKRKDGTVRHVGKGNIWSRESYGDFRLRLEFKLSEAANSGVFFRADPSNPVQGGFEIQLLDNEGFAKKKSLRSGRNSNGALYDAKAPSQDASRPVGQWNSMELVCLGSSIIVKLNGQEVVSVDIDQWKEPGKNPDGTDNKFKTALAELPRTGHIGLQNHGNQVWFRNIKIQPLTGGINR